MTKSSESASIACYELQNARRESLLSQNWTVSEEEDMNASLNTEEKNMNMLLFDHKMIKISINIELNAWISTYEADDIIVFIKYICQQHDIKIKIHNDMIQMLKDVNKINITLKIMQTRLQKENRNKNMIIHHLKAASSWQSTLISEDWFSKSIKLLNSSLFKDSMHIGILTKSSDSLWASEQGSFNTNALEAHMLATRWNVCYKLAVSWVCIVD